MSTEKYDIQIRMLQAEGYQYTEDKSKMNVEIIHEFLSTQSTWALKIPLSVVQKSMDHSLCFAILYKEKLVAFSRVVSDLATFANLVDVFVLPEHRHKSLSVWLTGAVLKHPDLQQLRRFTLATTTAKSLYEKFGFKELLIPHSFMEIYKPNLYQQPDYIENKESVRGTNISFFNRC